MSYLKNQIEDQEALYSDLINNSEKNKAKYEKPEILAQNTKIISVYRSNNNPSERPCNPPRPGGY